TDATVVQVDPSVETWTSYAVACAASHSVVTRPTCVVAPRSSASHWSSDHLLAQRVPRSPSLARRGASPPSSVQSVDDAEAAAPVARLAGAVQASVADQ